MENLLKIIGNTIGGSYEVYIMRILIVWIARFLGHNGGMEKVSIRFANEMIERGHSVALAYCTEHDGKAYNSYRFSRRSCQYCTLFTRRKMGKP